MKKKYVTHVYDASDFFLRVSGSQYFRGSGKWGWGNFSLKFPVKILRNFQEFLYNLTRSGNTEQNKKHG
jgi:hypothetical protein